jgi:hypothetical protein
VDRPTLTWIAPDGSIFNLGNWNPAAGPGFFALDGVKGLGAAPRTITADDSPRGGTTVRCIHPGPRMITLPMHIAGVTHAQYLDRERALAEAFASTRRLGPGWLQVQRPDGSVRQIQAVYSEGWDPEGGPTWCDVVPILYCPDPFFQAATATQLVAAYGASAGDFLNPFPNISSSTALGSSTATNPGTVEAWPTWTVSGPASLVTITNLTTGATFTVDPNAAGIAWGNLTAGQTVTISTNPARILGPDGSAWTAALNWPSATLWSLDPGVSTVQVSAIGAATGTQVVGGFYARFDRS